MDTELLGEKVMGSGIFTISNYDLTDYLLIIKEERYLNEVSTLSITSTGDNLAVRGSRCDAAGRKYSIVFMSNC